MATPPQPLAIRPLTDSELEQLQDELDRVPAPLEPLDVSMVDGFLCGVLVQPQAVPPARWMPHITDVDGRGLPRGFNASRLQALVLRRHDELADAIGRRQWFDPWIFELEAEGGALSDEEDDDGEADTSAVYPWVAGFAAAIELFPALMRADAHAISEPLALLYRHLDPEDLEDADELIELIESLEPPADLGAAVEEVVRATLLLADAGRPAPAPAPARRRPQRLQRPRH